MTETTTTETRVRGFICLIPNYWGWGETVAEAAVKCRAACKGRESVRKGKRAVYQLPEGAIDAWVDNMGSIQWTWGPGYAGHTEVGEWVETPA